MLKCLEVQVAYQMELMVHILELPELHHLLVIQLSMVLLEVQALDSMVLQVQDELVGLLQGEHSIMLYITQYKQYVL